MSAVPVIAAAAAEGTLAEVLKDVVLHLTSPEMFHALSPTEGFETKPHTFQAIETEGRWKMPPDWDAGNARLLVPPANKKGKLQKYQATVLSINIKAIDPQFLQSVLQLAFAAGFPPAQLLSMASQVASVASGDSSQSTDILTLFVQLLQSLIPQTQLYTTALQPLMNKFPAQLAQILASLTQILPSISRSLGDIQTTASSAEIEAVWWSDGFEIYAGKPLKSTSSVLDLCSAIKHGLSLTVSRMGIIFLCRIF